MDSHKSCGWAGLAGEVDERRMWCSCGSWGLSHNEADLHTVWTWFSLQISALVSVGRLGFFGGIWQQNYFVFKISLFATELMEWVLWSMVETLRYCRAASLDKYQGCTQELVSEHLFSYFGHDHIFLYEFLLH